MSHELPDPPDGWTASTTAERHVAFLRADGDRESLAVLTAGDPDGDDWRVVGLAGFGPDHPVFADGASVSDALATAVEVMEAHGTEEGPDPVRHASVSAASSAGEDTDTADGESDPEVDSAGETTDDPDDADESGPRQPSLGEWAEESS